MRLAHRGADAPAPRDIQIAEPAVAVAIPVLGPIFFPEQEQRDAAAAQLGMDMVPVRHRPRRRRVKAGGREQPPLQLGVVDLHRHRPGDPDHRRAAQVFRHRAVPDADRARDRPHTRAARILQSQNFSHFPHRQSLRWHRVPPAWRTTLPVIGSSTAPPNAPPQGCPGSIGITVRLPSESVSTLRRNHCPSCVGIRRQDASRPLSRMCYLPEGEPVWASPG